MYKSILAAVDEFTNSAIAARYAMALAKSCQAELSLVYVAEDKITNDLFSQAEASLERLFMEAKKQNIKVGSLTERGNPLKQINDLVKKNNVDIVFTATGREDIEKKFFLMTMAREFMLKLPCSVAMVRAVQMGRVHPRKILLPLRADTTNIEEQACLAAKLAEAFEAAVTVFHSTSPTTSVFRRGRQPTTAQRGELISENIEKFMECLNRYEIIHEKRTSHGSFARAVTIEAAHRRNDLIVMGASERSILKSIISGNPVEDVLRETPCNLIILRPKKIK
ncbi:MAG: universal stress protein [Syntrophales bacterium]